MTAIAAEGDNNDLAVDVYAAFDALRANLGVDGASPIFFLFNEDTGEFVIHAQSHYRRTVLRFLKTLPGVRIDEELEEKVKA